MRINILGAVLLWAAVSFAADKNKLPLEQTSNELTEISATIFIDKDQIHQELGADPGSDIVLVKVQVRAVSSKPVSISHDDFVLFSEKDGQRSEPFEPGQIAGSATLVVTPGGARGGGVANQRKGPSFGGGMGGARIGGGSASTPEASESKVESTDSGAKDSPLLAILKAKILPEKDITDSVSGYLYFQIEGKVKTKDLELYYKTPAGKLGVRFR